MSIHETHRYFLLPILIALLIACGDVRPSVVVETENPGANCQTGGIAVYMGEDVQYVCNGGQASPGMPGTPGETGQSCWDLDSDGTCALEFEDVNLDGQCDPLDCRPSDVQSPRILYQRLMTARWLLDNAIFPSPRSLLYASDAQGTRLHIGPGNLFNEKLFEVPLFAAGELSLDRVYAVHIQVWTWTSHIIGDDDLSIGISDGVHVAAFMRHDSSNPEMRLVTYNDGDIASNEAPHAVNVNDGQKTHHSFELTLRLGEITEMLAWLDISTNLPFAATSNFTLDRSQALELVAFGNDRYEQYDIHAVEVTVTEESL